MNVCSRHPCRYFLKDSFFYLQQLHPFKRGAWSEQEVQHLAELVQRLGKKWSTIQAKLNRSADSCRDKYREMSDDYVKGRWKVHETEQLERLIREHVRECGWWRCGTFIASFISHLLFYTYATQLSADPSMDMKDLGKYVEEEGITIPWSSISKRMGTRSRLSCFKRWQKLSGTGQMEDDDDDDDVDPQQPPAKRLKTTDYHAVHAAMASQDYDTYSAKIAAETVEAVELPDTEALMENVRDI